jgi:putative ABC transport system permease protein
VVSGLLGRKVRRDAGRQAGQFAAVAVTIAIATCAFVAALASYRNLQTSLDVTYSRLRLADVLATGPDAPMLAAHAREMRHVAVAQRSQADVGIRLRGQHALRGRIVGLPDNGGNAAVNRLLVLEGSEPKPGEVAVEKHLADHWSLRPGSTVEVATPTGAWRSLRVSGVVASPEYLFPARSRQELVTTPEDFGVVFGANSLVRDVAGSAANEQTGVYALNRARATTLTTDVERAAAKLSLTEVVTRATQPSAQSLDEDVQGFGTLALLFPLLFLTAGALATWVLLGRLVAGQRAVIGTLLACGIPRRRLLTHYVTFGIATATTGGVVGIAGGVLLGRWITGLYTGSIGLPITVNRWEPAILAIAVVAVIVVGALAALGPARAAIRIAPAQAMRATTPGGRGGRSLLERALPPLRRLPSRWAMVLRNIGRSRRRSLSTLAGVALAVALVLLAWSILDTSNILLSRQFSDIQHEDAEVEINPAADVNTTIAAIGQTPGVGRVEPAVRVPVALTHAGKRYSTLLIALPADTQMHGFRAPDGGYGTLPKSGLLAGTALRDKLGINVGDTVSASIPGAGVTARSRIAGFVDEPFGALAYADLAQLQHQAGTPIVTAAFVQLKPGADRLDVRGRISALPGVTGYTDVQALHAILREQMGLFNVILGIMLAFGALLAAALCFNAMTANVAERRGEIAALEVAGMPTRTLQHLVSSENLLVAAAGLPIGVVLGLLLARAFLSTYTSDLYRWTLQVHWWTLLLAAAAIFAAAVIAELPALRSLGRINLGHVVRERSL